MWPVVSYGAAVWGSKMYYYIDAVQDRAMRHYFGTGKYSTNAAVSWDIGWQPLGVRQWKAVCAYWYQVTVMYVSRLNKHVFLWSKSKASHSCKKWYFIIKEMLKSLDFIQNYSVPYEETQSNRVSDFRDLFCVLCFQRQSLFTFILPLVHLKAVKTIFCYM